MSLDILYKINRCLNMNLDISESIKHIEVIDMFKSISDNIDMKFTTLINNIAILKKENESLKRENQKLKEEKCLNVMNIKMTTLINNIAILKEENESLKRDNCELKEEKCLNATNIKNKYVLKNMNDNMRQQNLSIKKENQILKISNKDLKKNNKTLQKENESLSKTNIDLQKTKDKYEKLEHDYVKLKQKSKAREVKLLLLLFISDINSYYYMQNNKNMNHHITKIKNIRNNIVHVIHFNKKNKDYSKIAKFIYHINNMDYSIFNSLKVNGKFLEQDAYLFQYLSNKKNKKHISRLIYNIFPNLKDYTDYKSYNTDLDVLLSQ